LDIEKFISEINHKYPTISKKGFATDAMIKNTEVRIGHKLPESYKTFLKNFSNGMSFWNSEYIYSSEELGFESLKYPLFKYVKIIGTDKCVSMSNLICFTIGEAINSSNSCWAFICDGEYPNNEYKVGYITQSKGNIVEVLDNFEEWIAILWKNHDIKEINSVFHILHNSWDLKETLWSLDW
jgi:hypothetical protein